MGIQSQRSDLVTEIKLILEQGIKSWLGCIVYYALNANVKISSRIRYDPIIKRHEMFIN